MWDKYQRNEIVVRGDGQIVFIGLFRFGKTLTAIETTLSYELQSMEY